MSRKTVIRRIIKVVAQLIRGGVCLACGRHWSGEAEICHSCIDLLPRVQNPCALCGLNNKAPEHHTLCPKCLINPPVWQAMYSPYHYSGLVRRFLLNAKFSTDLPPIKSLCLGHDDFADRAQPWPEVLLPVPLHNKRLRQRGFNQAEEIAGFWSARFDIPVDRNSLQRIRETTSQSGLNARQRSSNIRRAFTCSHPGYRHVALVDDIVTTGSTVAELTRLLHAQGVELVEVWALGRACRKDQMR